MSIMLSLLAAASFAGEAKFVDADVLRVRAEPTTESAIEARVPRNATLTVTGEKEGWSRVAIERFERRIEGWVASKFLADAETPVAAVDKPVYVAVCESLGPDVYPGRAKLVARWTPGQGFEDMTSGGSWGEEGAEAAKAARIGDVAGQRWYLSFHDSYEHASVTKEIPWQWGVAPFWTDTWNEEAPSAFEPSDSGESYEQSLVVGPCDYPGQVMATAPLTHEQPQPVALTDAVRTLEALDTVKTGTLYGARVSRPLADRGFSAVELEVPWEWRSCGGDSHAAPTTAFVLMNGSEPVLAFGGGLATEADEDGSGPSGAEAPQWYSLAYGGEQHVLGVLASTYGYGGGYSLVDLDPTSGEVKTNHVMVETWGC